MNGYPYYDRVLLARFEHAYATLQLDEQHVLQADCHDLHNDPDGRDLDCYDVVNLLAERIGGSDALRSYVDCLMVRYRREMVTQ